MAAVRSELEDVIVGERELAIIHTYPLIVCPVDAGTSPLVDDIDLGPASGGRIEDLPLLVLSAVKCTEVTLGASRGSRRQLGRCGCHALTRGDDGCSRNCTRSNRCTDPHSSKRTSDVGHVFTFPILVLWRRD